METAVQYRESIDIEGFPSFIQYLKFLAMVDYRWYNRYPELVNLERGSERLDDSESF